MHRLLCLVVGAAATTCPATPPTDAAPQPVGGCDFDDSFCGWNGTSAARWTLGEGATPTRFTGPDGGVNQSRYAFVEASHPNHPAVTFELTSPRFDAPAASMSFHYSMYGAAIGSLAVDAYENGVWRCDVWVVEGDMGDAAWRFSGAIDVGASLRLRLRAVTGNGAGGDVAIDHLDVVGAVSTPSLRPTMVSPSSPPSPKPPPAPTAAPGNPTAAPVLGATPAPVTRTVATSKKNDDDTIEDALSDPDAASAGGLVYLLGGLLLLLSCGLLGAVRLKHCAKPKPPLHVELGLQKPGAADPARDAAARQRRDDEMRFRRQQLGAAAWSSDESGDEEAPRRDEEQERAALFGKAPAGLQSLETIARAAHHGDASAAAPARPDARLVAALADAKDWDASSDDEVAGLVHCRPASPEDMCMSDDDEELEIREHPEFSPQKLALYDDFDRRSEHPSPALLLGRSLARARASSPARFPADEAFPAETSSLPSPALFPAKDEGRSASPWSGDSWTAGESDGDWPSSPSPDAPPPPPPWQGDASPGSFAAREFSADDDGLSAADGSASSGGWPEPGGDDDDGELPDLT